MHGHTGTHSAMAPQQKFDVKHGMLKGASPRPSGRDDKVLRRPDAVVHPALRSRTDSTSSTYDGYKHRYRTYSEHPPRYDQR